MKKIMVVLVVMAMFLFSFNVFAQAQSSWSVKAGIDFGSELEVDGQGDLVRAADASRRRSQF